MYPCPPKILNVYLICFQICEAPEEIKYMHRRRRWELQTCWEVYKKMKTFFWVWAVFFSLCLLFHEIERQLFLSLYILFSRNRGTFHFNVKKVKKLSFFVQCEETEENTVLGVCSEFSKIKVISTSFILIQCESIFH